ncbi:hypothetical protein B0F90DRAFT_1668933 [Multifurca ochricompacta]|uniref:Uncharacterized protein n=1 Tax=Multifurca ochricompacta TaxID=376703 RepID=A0AAD4M1L7_9AGAM|nr:hypothetical protein B0F90DRAFT_1668933 [Multifurca ochricompacta]
MALPDPLLLHPKNTPNVGVCLLEKDSTMSGPGGSERARAPVLEKLACKMRARHKDRPESQGLYQSLVGHKRRERGLGPGSHDRVRIAEAPSECHVMKSISTLIALYEGVIPKVDSFRGNRAFLTLKKESNRGTSYGMGHPKVTDSSHDGTTTLNGRMVPSYQGGLGSDNELYHGDVRYPIKQDFRVQVFRLSEARADGVRKLEEECCG